MGVLASEESNLRSSSDHRREQSDKLDDASDGGRGRCGGSNASGANGGGVVVVR